MLRKLALTALLATLAGLVATAPALGAETLLYERGPVPIPNGHGAAKMRIDGPAVGGATAQDVEPNFRIRHAQTRNLRLLLEGPDGTRVLLSDRETHGENLGEQRCGNDPLDLSYTGFDDEAATPLSAGSAPYSGFFQPHEPLTALDSQPVEESWTLIVRDVSGGPQGKLLCGAILIEHA